MSEVAIRVERLGKQYRIGTVRGSKHRTLRDTLSGAVADSFRRARGILRSPENGLRPADGTFWALKDVSFEIQRGEVVGIIGRNAAGKSTLLKILSRITEPTTGSAEIHGSVSSLLEVGSGFHAELTGRENIFLNGAILGMPKTEIIRRFDEIVSFSEVEKFIDTPVKHYSSGMYLRLAFAVAAHLEPEILIVDEVLAVGDAAFQAKCLGKMEDVARRGRTVLFVSHNISAVERLCETGVVLAEGRVLFRGNIGDAVSCYLASVNPYVTSGSSEGPGFADLLRHPGRQAGARPLLQSLALLGPGSPRVLRDRLKTGEDAVFEIRYDAEGTKLDMAFLAINSLRGERVCTVGTHLSPGPVGVLPGKGTLQCRLPSLPLAAGDYVAVVAIGQSFPRKEIDRVEFALRFRVETGDYFGTGAALHHSQGSFAQRSEWKVVPGAGELEVGAL